MRNLGIIVLVLGLLLLILPDWFINAVGIIGAICGLLTILFPDKASELIAKFGPKSEKKD